MDNLSILWGAVIIGGPILLVSALIWAKLRTGPKTRRDDPNTPSDDPAKGMKGHG
jgi:hypothetical protein